jgi:peptide methionine sulfoxide reductase msrA/msrB
MEQKKAYFAGGCFWGVEHLFQAKPGVVNAVSGYMGGELDNPSYQDVLTGRTGHLESVEITYDPAIVTFEELTRFFFEIHDPTQANGQGPDIGPQYLSAVFYSEDKEKEIAADLIDVLNEKGYDVVTQLLPAERFWKAEEYHQDYYVKKNQMPYCHVYQKKF